MSGNHSYYVFTNLTPTDIYPVEYGEEQCKKGHYFGPFVRKNYLLHYIYNGEGIFRTENNEYKLHSGQMFLIEPHRLTYYKADDNNPWLYRWLEFNGSMAPKILKSAGLSSDMPIFIDDENQSSGKALLDIVNGGDMRFEEFMQKFWAFISTLTKDTDNEFLTPAQEYVQKAENFIKTSIHKKITVNDAAEYIGINRSYLTRLFKQYKNISPKQYILALKMNTAAQYLKNTGISITEAAQSVGFFDTHAFDKAFKSHFNMSPSKWRIWHKKT